MKQIIFAGFGGQGVLTGGLIISYMAAERGLNTTWMPAYGASMRGGKANCVVKVGETPEERIGSPLMGHANVLIAMNQPSLDYLEKTNPDGIVLVNSHAVDDDYVYPEGVSVYKVDCVDLAAKAKNKQGQSLVMLGAVMKLTEMFSKEEAEATMCRFFEEKGKSKYNDANVAAFRLGYDAV